MQLQTPGMASSPPQYFSSSISTFYIMYVIIFLILPAYRVPIALGLAWWTGPPLRGADRNLLLSPGRIADHYYQELVPGRAAGQGK